MAITTRIIAASALLCVSLGAFAQQDAVRAIHASGSTPATVVNPRQSQDAAALAHAIDAYNSTANTGAVADRVIEAANVQNRAASPAAQRLARAVRAYNGERSPVTDTVDYTHTPDQGALALGREVTQFNRSGGSLDVVGTSMHTLP